MYGCGNYLILIPFRLPQISCFTLSLKCFSSDSDNRPDVGIIPPHSVPLPTEGQLSESEEKHLRLRVKQLIKRTFQKCLVEGGGQLEGRISGASGFIVSSHM